MFSISFYGSSDFSLIILEKLFELYLSNKITLVYVVSQPSKIFGHKKELKDNPVVAFCKENEIPFLTPTKINELKKSDKFQTNIDLAIVAAYGKILPEWLLNSTKYGFLNIHGSLLPKYRGAVPVQFCILNQDLANTGITFIKMDKGMDTGKIISSVALTSFGWKNQDFSKFVAGELMIKLAHLGAEVLEKDFDYIFNPANWNLVEQDHSTATYCYVSDMNKENFEVKYEDGVKLAHGKIMAANPEPKAFIKLKTANEEFTMNILRSALVDIKLKKLNMLSLHKSGKKLFLELHDGFLEILEIQPFGKKVMDAMSFMNGHSCFLYSC